MSRRGGRRVETEQPAARRRYDGGELLDVAGTAALLGTTERAVRARIARRQLPHLRLGGRVVVRRAALLAFLESLEVPASE